MDSQEIFTAGERFRRAWDSSLTPGGHSLPFAGIDVMEFREAALQLMRATRASNLRVALQVLHDSVSEDEEPANREERSTEQAIEQATSVTTEM